MFQQTAPKVTKKWFFKTNFSNISSPWTLWNGCVIFCSKLLIHDWNPQPKSVDKSTVPEVQQTELNFYKLPSFIMQRKSLFIHPHHCHGLNVCAKIEETRNCACLGSQKMQTCWARRRKHFSIFACNQNILWYFNLQDFTMTKANRRSSSRLEHKNERQSCSMRRSFRYGIDLIV